MGEQVLLCRAEEQVRSLEQLTHTNITVSLIKCLIFLLNKNKDKLHLYNLTIKLKNITCLLFIHKTIKCLILIK